MAKGKGLRPMRDGEEPFDPSPMYAFAIVRDETNGVGYVTHWMAFDPAYGPESEAQIEYWQRRGYPGAETWEVGKKVRVYSERQALAHMQRHQQEQVAA